MSLSARATQLRNLLGPLAGVAQDLDEWQGGGYRPEDFGLIAWTADPTRLSSVTNTVLTSGRQVLQRIRLPNCTVTNIHTAVRAVSSPGFTTGNMVGLFDSVGQQLAVSGELTAADATAWGSVGAKVHAMGTPVKVPRGYYYIGIIMNASSMPSLSALAPDTTTALVASLGTSASRAMYTDTTTRTALQSSYTLTGLATASVMFWFGVS